MFRVPLHSYILQRICVAVLSLGISAPLLASAAEELASTAKLVRVPDDFLRQRVLLLSDAPPESHLVQVESVPRGISFPIAFRVLKTSGDEIIDRIAVDFAARHFACEANGGAEAQSRSVSVALLIVPPRLAVTENERSVPPVENEWAKARRAAGEPVFHTPQPNYPYQALKARQQGRCLVQMRFIQGSRFPQRVAMSQPTGGNWLDANTLKWALRNWSISVPAPTSFAKRVPMQLILK